MYFYLLCEVYNHNEREGPNGLQQALAVLCSQYYKLAHQWTAHKCHWPHRWFTGTRQNRWFIFTQYNGRLVTHHNDNARLILLRSRINVEYSLWKYDLPTSFGRSFTDKCSTTGGKWIKWLIVAFIYILSPCNKN